MLEGTSLDGAYMLLSDLPAAGMDVSRPINTSARANGYVATPQQQPQQTVQTTRPVSTIGGQQSDRAEQAAIQQAYYNQQMKLAQIQQQQHGTPPPRQTVVYERDVQEGYMDNLLSKKKDIMKLVIMAMMILLALSIHSLVTFWMTDYIKSTDLSFKQELGFRLMYPVLAFALLWNLKAMK